jgi:hypothetical protein
MKRPGARWKHETGEDVLQLRSLVLSDRWVPAMQRALKPLAKLVRVHASWGLHPPMTIFVMLVVVLLANSLYAGYGMAVRRSVGFTPSAS